MVSFPNALVLNANTKQINTKNFYLKYPYKLTSKFYNYALSKARKRKKKIGLAVSDPKTFKEYSNLKFDFYKLLSIGINNLELLSMLNNIKKNLKRIRRCFLCQRRYSE